MTYLKNENKAMKASIFLPALWAISVFFQVGCKNAAKKQAKDTLKQDTTQKVKKQEPKARHFDPIFDETAKYIAGIYIRNPKHIDTSLYSLTAWKNYRNKLNKNWSEYETTRLQKIEEWRNTELKAINERKYNLFYPFSGPDILHAAYFFPNADTINMIGLEPVGEIVQLNKEKFKEPEKFFRSAEISLQSILRHGFFKTAAMRVDLSAQGLNGTIPVMMLFLGRMGYIVENMQFIYVDPQGKINKGRKQTDKEVQGIEIAFSKGADKPLKILRYFSADISDEGLKKKTPAFVTYIKSLGRVTTYLKAASYLLHRDEQFPTIRKLILDQSDWIVQDDTGIPLKYLPDNSWQKTYYGTYTKPIAMFAVRFQKDLKEKYSDKEKVKPLPFLVGGYNMSEGEKIANMMVAQRIK
ncbi:MAG: hypothetical protein NZ519_00535 [Bacteroidia bacterium]|nr:hypothetical protein [Bacteroidia bacterium]MDW8301222.1 hypothetical protein [Bacteroidia bacterium]